MPLSDILRQSIRLVGDQIQPTGDVWGLVLSLLVTGGIVLYVAVRKSRR